MLGEKLRRRAFGAGLRARSRSWVGLWLPVSVFGLAGCSVYNSKLVNGATGASDGGLVASVPDAGGAAGAKAAPDAGPSPVPVLPDAGVPTFDPDTCSWGQCWWSIQPADGCQSAGVPRASDRPAVAEDGKPDVPDFYLGFTQVRVGSTNRLGEATDDAWEDFGFDLDGLCTNSSTCPGSSRVSCQNSAPALPYDGQLCRDNTFARLQPVVAKVPEIGQRFGLNESVFNCSLWRGSYNAIVRISGYNGKPDDANVRVDFYDSNGTEEAAPWSCPADNFKGQYPRWRSSLKWRINRAGLAGTAGSTPGSLPNSITADPNAYVKHGYLVAQLPDGSKYGFVGDGMPYNGFRFNTHRALFVGNIVKAQDGTWAMRDGLTAGRIVKSDLAQAFREIGFCANGDDKMFYESMLGYLDDNADVLSNGATDPNMPCDALSYGIAFDAAQITPGMVVDLPPRIECCAPGKTLEQCSAVCGDGKVSGDEQCDTAIADGKPGACPKSCTPMNACTPRVVQGAACAATCAPMPITKIGAKDSCCPPGANATNDVDCTAQCGNNVIEGNETCDPPSSCAPCTTSNSCLAVKSTGSADTCDLRCSQTPITQCHNGDHCCPSGCSKSNDQDCSSSCGNRTIDSGETCEANTNKPCPTTCNDNQSCTIDMLVGSASNCNAVCTNVAITQAVNGDACCPNGATANNDSDCMAQCGNKIVETGEQCDDGNQVAGDGCVNCQTETPTQACLVKLNSSDACAMCTCNKCTTEALACEGASSADEAMACDAMVKCGRKTGCRNPGCLCGTADVLLCAAGAANGPCMKEVFAAAKTNVVLTIQTRASDTTYPIGRANALGTCVDMNCATECKPASP
jgi:cysteine-rich repeat protein